MAALLRRVLLPRYRRVQGWSRKDGALPRYVAERDLCAQPRRRRRKGRAGEPAYGLGALAAWGLVLCACGRPVSDAECLELLDRYTTLLSRADDPKLTEAELATRRAEARAITSAVPFGARCQRHVSRRGFECAMRAPSVDEIERCLP